MCVHVYELLSQSVNPLGPQQHNWMKCVQIPGTTGYADGVPVGGLLGGKGGGSMKNAKRYGRHHTPMNDRLVTVNKYTIYVSFQRIQLCLVSCNAPGSMMMGGVARVIFWDFCDCRIELSNHFCTYNILRDSKSNRSRSYLLSSHFSWMSAQGNVFKVPDASRNFLTLSLCTHKHIYIYR